MKITVDELKFRRGYPFIFDVKLFAFDTVHCTVYTPLHKVLIK